MGKKNYKPDYFASVDTKDTFGMIFASMLKHPAYKKLSIGAKQFYTLCRVQARSSECKRCLYEHGKKFGIIYTENDFVFPAKHMKKYGYQKQNGSKYLNQLIAAGFIRKKEDGKPVWQVSVYSFSDIWKDSG